MSWDSSSMHKKKLLVSEYKDRSYIVIYLRTAVLYIKKELPVLEYKDRSYIVICHQHIVDMSSTCRCRVVVVSLISHPYGD